VFAPVLDLGLIVIDEEHESSYQSDKNPRYHALEIAQQRVKLTNATLLLGSATPSLTSYYRALHGRYALLSMPERVLSRPLPKVRIVDMRAEFAAGNNSIFSEPLARALAHTFARGEQAMLFLNRRGYSTFVSCRSCGYVLKCEQCDVSMTWHKLENRTRCHYCNAVSPLPKECPNCHKPFLKYFGVGTEQVEEQFAALFPDVPFARMDSDTMGTKGAYARLLSDFARGATRALIGTQMIAKGHDFPNVTLIGVIAADTTLNLPSYLSRERTFQLLTQVSGRSGRDALPGTVIVQTYSPDHAVIGFSRAHDYPAFFHYELMERKKGLLPPFSLFARVLFLGADQHELSQIGNAFARELEKKIVGTLGVQNSRALLHLSAAPAPINRIQNEWRYQVLVKLLRTAQLKDALNCIFEAAAELDLPRKPHIEINPTDMY
ncbi:MAG: primosomal protein N', partial [Clostridiales bacterium]|nr:primosomal protein N' [Clostridiales bacterium]